MSTFVVMIQGGRLPGLLFAARRTSRFNRNAYRFTERTETSRCRLRWQCLPAFAIDGHASKSQSSRGNRPASISRSPLPRAPVPRQTASYRTRHWLQRRRRAREYETTSRECSVSNCMRPCPARDKPGPGSSFRSESPAAHSSARRRSDRSGCARRALA